jgi:hypothetical protein
MFKFTNKLKQFITYYTVKIFQIIDTVQDKSEWSKYPHALFEVRQLKTQIVEYDFTISLKTLNIKNVIMF